MIGNGMKGKRILATILATTLTFAGVGDMNIATVYAGEYEKGEVVANVTNEATYPLADDSDALPDLFAEDSDTHEHENVRSRYIKENDNSYNYEQYHYYKCDVCKKMIAEEHTWSNDYVECEVCGLINISAFASGQYTESYNGEPQSIGADKKITYVEYKLDYNLGSSESNILLVNIKSQDPDSDYVYDEDVPPTEAVYPTEVGKYEFKFKGYSGRTIGEMTFILEITQSTIAFNQLLGDKGYYEIYKGDSRKIDKSLIKDGNHSRTYENEKFSFEIKDSNIAVCDEDGIITGKAIGETTIAIYSKNIVKNDLKIKVVPYPVSAKTSGTLYTGTSSGDNVFDGDDDVEVTFSFEDGISPATATYTIDGVTISDGSDDFVLDKSTGKVTIKKPGKYKVKATIAKRYDLNSSEKDFSAETEICVFGDRDPVTLTPNATIQFDGEPIEEGTDFTLDGKEDNDTISYSYRLKSAGEDAVYTPGLPVNAGVYEVKAEIDDNSAKCLKPVSTSAVLTIVKGDFDTNELEDYEKEYPYCDECEREEIDLTKLVPINAGEVTFEIKDKSYTGADTVSGCSIKDGKLIYNVPKMAAFADNTSTTIDITVTSDNYNDYTQKIVITRTKCNHPEDKIDRKTKILPKCETAGEDIRVCNRCGETVETGIVVPALGHDYHDGICTREGCGVVSFELCNDISISAESVLYDGNTHVPTVTVSYKGETLTKDTDYKLTVESKTEVGEYELTVTGINKYRDSIRKKWSIVPPQRGLWCADIPDQVYTGTAIKPEIEVYNDGIKLVAGKDYTISYKNNIKVAAKDAVNNKQASIAPSVTITGKGNYADKKTVNFAIVKCNIDTSNVDNITVAKTNTDIKITPNVILNGKKLKAGTDYVVSTTPDVEGAVASYKEAGTYNLYVVGKGNYTGSVSFTFTITEKILAGKVTIAKIPDQKYDGGNAVIPLEDTVKITYNKKDVKECFDIEYKDNNEIGTATVIIKAKEGVKSSITGKEFVGTKKVTYKIVGEKISGAKLGANGKGTIPAGIYSGKPYEPELDLYYGDTKLTRGTDYEVTYSKNVNVGKTATALVTGKGAYMGTKKFTYKINKYNAATDEKNIIEINGAQGEGIIEEYAKGGVLPKPILSINGIILKEKKDYTYSYANNKSVTSDGITKKPTITITFKGNLTGKRTIEFIIVPKNISECRISLADKAVSTKKNAWKQTKVTITDTNGKTLKAGVDYNNTIQYYSDADCKNEITNLQTIPEGTLIKGMVYVKVTGINNYANSQLIGSYRISKTSISSARVTVKGKEYTGEEIILSLNDIKLTLGKGKNTKTLNPETDYEIVEESYKNNINKGTASVTIRGIGDYYGTKVVKYKIVANKILWWN